MRRGQNPMNWFASVHQPERITVCTIVFIPSLDGYWEQSLDVLKICLRSLRESTEVPFDLMVFDNGSCAAVVEYLTDAHQQHEIQYLMLSDTNVGKTGAWNMLFAAAPGDIVSYTDSDILFFPGWLEKSLELLETFPQAGLISAQAHRWTAENSPATMEAIAGDNTLTVEKGALLPEGHLLYQRIGLGDSEERFRERITGRQDVRISRDRVTAYVGATHCQFLSTKQHLTQIMPFPVTSPVGRDEGQLEERTNHLKRWLLSTSEYLFHHMGNRLPSSENDYDGLRDILPEIALNEIRPKKTIAVHSWSGGSIRHWILRRSRVRGILKRINVLTYRLLSEK